MNRFLSIVLAFVICLSFCIVPVYSAQSKVITVGKDGDYDFETIQEAVDSVTSTGASRTYIKIAKGEYEEVVKINKPYITLSNLDSTRPEDVVITYDRASSHENIEKRFGTQDSATVTIEKSAFDFSAENITIQNSYNLNQPRLGEDGGREQTQAVAFVSLSDRAQLYNCRLIGRQDTVYLKGASKGNDVYGSANNARCYMRDCFIEGTVDFIFGDATAVFEDCTLNMAYYKNGGHYTAANTTLFNVGFVFINCKLTADSKYGKYRSSSKNIDLGRPWQSDSGYPNYGSSTVFINCSLPDALNPKGWSLWNSSTVENKIRYYEYGSTVDGKPADTSDRADFSKILTNAQAKAYTTFNILRGTDNWKPSYSKQDDMKSEKLVTDITLDKYNIELPKYEKTNIKAFLIPDGTASYRSTDETVATVTQTGEITAVKEGTAKIYARTPNLGFEVYCNVTVMPAKTSVPVIKDISLSKTSDICPNDTIELDYSYKLESDNKMDTAKIKWYSIKDGQELVVKEGRGNNFKSYTVSYADIGSVIKAVVIPETKTTYSDQGNETPVSTEEVKRPEGRVPQNYVREGFSNFETKCVAKGVSVSDAKWEVSTPQSSDITKIWNTVKIDGNDTIGAGNTDVVKLEYRPSADEAKWTDIKVSARMLFNPSVGGFSSSSYYNIYARYTENSYYRLEIRRGSNTNSLILNLYKKDSDNEELMASDTESLIDKVAQNSGDDNPWFDVSLVAEGNKITASLAIEPDSLPTAVIEVNDEYPVSGGFTALESCGKVNVLLLDMLSVDEVINYNTSKSTQTYSKNPTVFLAGDSTVCEYTDDPNYAIPRGGWGMYVGNYLKDINVKNLALSGRSSKSFTTEDNYKTLMNSISEGDYLVIEFGHNDEKNSTDDDIALRYTDPEKDIKDNTSFKYWLYEYYVKPAIEKGATPILATPVTRRKFDENGKVKDTHTLYANAIRELADEKDVALIDMTSVTMDYYNSIGEDMTKYLHSAYYDSEKGTDNTHFSRYGAETMAKFFLSTLVKTDCGLKNYIDYSKFNTYQDIYITRGEFITDLMNVLGLDEQDKINFSDVAEGKSYTRACNTAKMIGIAVGDEYGNFRPEDYITRQEMAVFTAKALEQLKVLKSADTSLLNKFSDANYVSPYARQAMADVVGMGIISGTKDGKILPASYGTKQQSAVVISKIYECK